MVQVTKLWTYLIKETISISRKRRKHSMSIVFKAKDETGKEFANKIFLDGSENKETIPHFDEKRLVRAMRKFNSFFVSSVDDEMFNGLTYFVMELAQTSPTICP